MNSGKASLYLDVYTNGKRTYEYLHLYLIPEKTRADKEVNRNTLNLADAIRAKRVLEVREGVYGLKRTGGAGVDLFLYLDTILEEKREKVSLSTAKSNQSAIFYLRDFCKPGMELRDVTPEFMRGFRNYLDRAYQRQSCTKNRNTRDKPLSMNSKRLYYEQVCAYFRKAYEDGLIPADPTRGVEGFKMEEKERVYLTVDEVRAMAATDCSLQMLKRAFLFSCLTGIRKSDILKMRWSEVRRQGSFTRIVFRQQKTGGQVYVDINPQAVEYMGERRNPDDLVFQGFSYSGYSELILKRWAQDAGVDKPVTFHSGRHTFAVMMLDLGTDLYTVSKLLGHRDIATTQVYAKVLDKNKQKAAMLIPDISLNRAPR
jgi:integrase